MKGRYEFDGSLGLAGLSGKRLLAASGRCEQAQGCTGKARLTVPDTESGLRYLEQPPTEAD